MKITNLFIRTTFLLFVHIVTYGQQKSANCNKIKVDIENIKQIESKGETLYRKCYINLCNNTQKPVKLYLVDGYLSYSDYIITELKTGVQYLGIRDSFSKNVKKIILYPNKSKKYKMVYIYQEYKVKNPTDEISISFDMSIMEKKEYKEFKLIISGKIDIEKNLILSGVNCDSI